MVETLSAPKLSACVITFNEEDRIADCVDALAFCDEVIVVDSGSTDATRELALEHGARVIDHAWQGYRTQKQFAIEQARHDWVLCVDADERVTAELRAEIAALRFAGFPDYAAWSIPRLTDYCGKFLRHGNAYPDRKVRLFDRRHGRWGGYEVHEKVEVNGHVGKLSGHLEHYAYRSLDDHLRRMNQYASLIALELLQAGRGANFAEVILRPFWRFLRGLIFKQGFRDGWRGLAFHFVESKYVLEKYLRVWLSSRAAGRRFVTPKATDLFTAKGDSAPPSDH